MKSKLIVIILSLTVLLTACPGPQKPETIPSVSLREEWFPSACFAGDMMAMNETGKANMINIKIEAGAEDVDPVKLVIAGSNDFGVAGADRIITANSKGADLVIIGVINFKTPTVFISLKDKNITKPKDFEGKYVGVMTGNNTEYVYRSLIQKSGVAPKKINEVEAPFDLATFIAKAYDVRPAFVYDELVSLDAQGIEYNTIRPEDYGVNFIGPVIFAKREFVEKNKDTVQKFVNALAGGWQAALNNPAQAIEYLKQFDANVDAGRETKSLIKGHDYFIGEDGKPLFLSEQRWNLFVNELIDLKLISSEDGKRNVFDSSFVNNYYKGSK